VHVITHHENGRTKYYLASSYREGPKVVQVTVFLGTDLGTDEVATLAQRAKKRLEDKVRAARSISDPYRTVLTSGEMAELTLLMTKVKVKLAHLSEDDWKAFTEEFTYHTNAIEGSSVSKKEVRQVLSNERWPDRSKEEIAETLGVAEAVKYLRQNDEPLSLELIKVLHKIVFKNSKTYAGETRQTSGVEVSVVDGFGNVVHRGTPANQVDSALRRLVKWYHDNSAKYAPFVLAAVVHNQFETIHPFQDGNGRVGRLLMINILLKHKMPPLNIELENRRQYYDALKEYQTTGNLRPTLDLMLKEYRRLKATLKR
jgi:Fic family protein